MKFTSSKFIVTDSKVVSSIYSNLCQRGVGFLYVKMNDNGEITCESISPENIRLEITDIKDET